MKRLSFRAAARTDLGEAKDWYRRQRIELAHRFVDRVEETLDRICRSPASYPVVFQDVRVILVPEFPYVVCFRDQPGRILVIAVMHARRDPDAWRSRA